MLSLGLDDGANAPRTDRRVSVRRREDFYWLQRMADVTGDACIVVGRNGYIDYIDPKILDVLEIEASVVTEWAEFSDMIRHMSLKGYFGPGEPEMFEALINDMLANQRLKQNELTQLLNAFTPNGRFVDIRISYGRDDGYVILMRDSTEIQLRDRALDTALKVGRSGYWSYNLVSGEFHVRADSLATHYDPKTFAAMQTKGFMDVIHPEDTKRVSEAMEQCVVTRQSHGIVVRIVGDDKSIIWLNADLMPNMDEGGQVRSLSCFFTNISEQIETEEELRVTKEDAETALKAKNAFLGRLSHEVRTPMNAVIGMADALVHNYDDPELAPKLSLIQNSAEKVIRLVDRTLEHAKLEDQAVEITPVPTSVAALCKSACASWNMKAAEGGTTLNCALHPNVPDHIMLDPLRFEQCLNNLVSNALKFAQGGTVQVAITVTGEPTRQKLILAVKDTGIGMDEAALSRIFLPFKQADNTITGRFGGTGLGLTITKDLVELMGGKISVSSKPSQGTMFVISLPLVLPKMATPPAQLESRPVAPSPAKVEPPISPFAHLRVLIVDDNATNHMVVSSLLSNVVGHIDTALNGQDAIDTLEKNVYDLVLMDIHMPVMDGIEATLAIRSSDTPYKSVPIIALTADPQYQQSRLCRNIGMNSSLAKPIKLSGLLEAFEEVLSSTANESAADQHAA